MLFLYPYGDYSKIFIQPRRRGKDSLNVYGCTEFVWNTLSAINVCEIFLFEEYSVSNELTESSKLTKQIWETNFTSAHDSRNYCSPTGGARKIGISHAGGLVDRFATEFACVSRGTRKLGVLPGSVNREYTSGVLLTRHANCSGWNRVPVTQPRIKNRILRLFASGANGNREIYSRWISVRFNGYVL